MRHPGEYIALSLPSNPRYLALLRTVVGTAADLLGFSEEEKHGMMLAVNEGCANIIQHCYRMDESQKIDLTIRIETDRMELELRDYGQFRDLGNLDDRGTDEMEPGGLGLKLISETMDEFVFRPADREGTLLTMVKYRRSGGRMKVATREVDGVPVVDVDGDVDMHSSPALLQALSRLTEDATPVIVVNLEKVGFMDSSGVATLVQALKEIRPHGGEIRLAAPGGNVLRVFKLSNLTSLFPSFDTVEEALSGGEAS